MVKDTLEKILIFATVVTTAAIAGLSYIIASGIKEAEFEKSLATSAGIIQKTHYSEYAGKCEPLPTNIVIESVSTNADKDYVINYSEKKSKVIGKYVYYGHVPYHNIR